MMLLMMKTTMMMMIITGLEKNLGFGKSL